jgi:hypothetical protein
MAVQPIQTARYALLRRRREVASPPGIVRGWLQADCTICGASKPRFTQVCDRCWERIAPA